MGTGGLLPRCHPAWFRLEAAEPALQGYIGPTRQGLLTSNGGFQPAAPERNPAESRPVCTHHRLAGTETPRVFPHRQVRETVKCSRNRMRRVSLPEHSFSAHINTGLHRWQGCPSIKHRRNLHLARQINAYWSCRHHFAIGPKPPIRPPAVRAWRAQTPHCDPKQGEDGDWNAPGSAKPGPPPSKAAWIPVQALPR